MINGGSNTDKINEKRTVPYRLGEALSLGRLSVLTQNR